MIRLRRSCCTDICLRLSGLKRSLNSLSVTELIEVLLMPACISEVRERRSVFWVTLLLITLVLCRKAPEDCTDPGVSQYPGVDRDVFTPIIIEAEGVCIEDEGDGGSPGWFATNGLKFITFCK
jgi:hypothetical protein